MSKQRHRRSSQGRTTTETRPQTCSGEAQFSVSEVAQFSMSLDKLSRRNHWMLRCEFAPHWMESQGFSPVNELEWLCVNFKVFEAPLRTPWNSRLEEVFKRPIEACEATCFVDYVKSLNHQCMGWVDLYLTSPNSELPLKIAEAPNSLSS